MKKLSKEGATNVIHANETGKTFVGNDTFYYLDWHQEPVTTLYAVYQLDECVDLEKARAVAFMLSSSCEGQHRHHEGDGIDGHPHTDIN